MNNKIIKPEYIFDAFYKNIYIEDQVIKELLNTKEMLRLHHIKQLGLIYPFFPSAVHTRFSHSLGVYYIVDRIFKEAYFQDPFNKKDKLIIKIASLLHDVGHGPFSHSFESLIKNCQDTQFNHHEGYSVKIIQDVNSDINKILTKYKININKVVEYIKPSNESYQLNLISSIIDADRLDYLNRDNLSLGLDIGKIGIDYIIQSMYFKRDNKKLMQIYFTSKSKSSIESFLFNRRQMYQALYFYPSSMLMDVILQNIFQRLTELYNQDQTKFLTSTNLNQYFLPFIKPILEKKPIPMNVYQYLEDNFMDTLLNSLLASTDQIISFLSFVWKNIVVFNKNNLITNKQNSKNDLDIANIERILLKQNHHHINKTLPWDEYLLGVKSIADKQVNDVSQKIMLINDDYDVDQAVNFYEINNDIDWIKIQTIPTKTIFFNLSNFKLTSDIEPD